MNPAREARLQNAAQSLLAQKTDVHKPPVRCEGGWKCPETGVQVDDAAVEAFAFPEGDHHEAYAHLREDGAA